MSPLATIFTKNVVIRDLLIKLKWVCVKIFRSGTSWRTPATTCVATLPWTRSLLSKSSGKSRASEHNSYCGTGEELRDREFRSLLIPRCSGCIWSPVEFRTSKRWNRYFRTEDLKQYHSKDRLLAPVLSWSYQVFLFIGLSWKLAATCGKLMKSSDSWTDEIFGHFFVSWQLATADKPPEGNC